MSRFSDVPPPRNGNAARSRSHSALLCISEISNVLARPGKLEDAFVEAVRLICSQPQIWRGLISFFEGSGQLSAVTPDGRRGTVTPPETERLLQSAIRQVLSAGKPLILRSSPGLLVSGDRDLDGRMTSLIGVPIRGDWVTLGAIIIERDRIAESHSEAVSEDICFLSVVARLLGQRLALRQTMLGAAPQSISTSTDANMKTRPEGFQHGHAVAGGMGKNAVRGRLVSRGKSLDPSDRQSIIDAMTRAGWVQAKAARLLGVSSRQMRYALQKHSIEVQRF